MPRNGRISIYSSLMALGAVMIMAPSAYLGLGALREKNDLSTFDQGLRTCFKRLYQSYQAKAGNSGGKSLGPLFMAKSKQCFSELLTFSEEKSVFDDSLKSQAQGIVQEASWLLGRMSEKRNLFSSANEAETLQGKFRKLEKGRLKLSQNVDRKRPVLDSRVDRMGISFGLSTGLVLSLLLFELRRKRQNWEKRQNIETQASDMLERKDRSALEVKRLIHKALWQEGLDHSGKLLEESFDLWKVGDNSMKNDSRNSARTHSFRSLKAKIEPKSTDLDKVLGKAIKVLSPQFFKKGVFLDIDVAQSVTIMAEDEALWQTLHAVGSYVLASKTDIQGQKVLIKGKKADGQFLLTIRAPFNEGNFSSMPTNACDLLDFDYPLDINLKIALSIMKDLGARVGLVGGNHEGQDSLDIHLVFSIAEQVVEVDENRAKVKDAKVTFVGKGRKSELTKSLLSESSEV